MALMRMAEDKPDKPAIRGGEQAIAQVAHRILLTAETKPGSIKSIWLKDLWAPSGAGG